MRVRQASTQRQGVALIAVLLVLFVIAALVLEFHYDARVRFQLTENTCIAYQALNCAEAGLAIATAVLEQTGNIWADDRLVELFSGALQVPVGEGYCTISVAGESGRINVNQLIDGNGRPVRTRIDQMLRLIDIVNAQNKGEDPISYAVVPAIIDWIDPDDEVTVLPFVQGQNAGAESDYYRGLEEPYECKNAPLDVLGELILVKGVTKDILYGKPRAGQSDATVGLEPFLAVHDRGRLNINDASVIMLQTLSEQIDRTLAEAILEYRPYTSMNELTGVPGMTPDVLRATGERASVQSGDECYTVTVSGTVGRSTRTLRVVLYRDRRLSRIVPLIRWEL